MQSSYDYKKFAVLYVDDEEMSLKGFARAFNDQFRILTAPNAREGLSLFEQHKDEIGVLMTDQRMPGENGVWLLERARQSRPRIVRILATAYSDMEAAIAAVNSGAIYKYVNKPWDPPQLEQTLKRGMEFFLIQRERDQLLVEKMSVLHNMMIADRIVSLGLLAAGLSHHIRNSLVAVKTFLDLAPLKMAEEKVASTGMRDPEFWKEYYANVQNQVEKINNLLKDLWTASETPSFQFNDQVRLRDVVNSTVDDLKAEFTTRQITVDNQIPDSLPALNVDKPKFYRLFELLLRDEAASLPAGSRVTLRAELLNGSQKPEIKVQISDNGPGLPAEALRVLFDPFVVRGDTPAEYGIHLMACFFIVYHHSGRIEAHSQEGIGTTFTLHLPLHPERTPLMTEDHDFLQRALLNEKVWERLIATS
ncbi:MAG TPA: hybrid sensor histidine kinase/response regulator [Verrucomicrobiota bacterium]|nr:hybrid sensor histidine kinase/response regulator [Verrucomicrobiota bacterium]